MNEEINSSMQKFCPFPTPIPPPPVYLKKKKLVLFKSTLLYETSLLTVKREHGQSFHMLARLSKKQK